MDVKSALGLIQLNSRKIQRNLEVIEERKRAYENAIAANVEHIETLQEQNRKLLDGEVKFPFKDLLLEIADEWGCDVSDLSLSNEIGSFVMEKSKPTDVWRRALSEISKRCDMLRISITSPSGRKSFSISLPIDNQLEEAQADGMALAEHISIAPQELITGKISYVMKFDDLTKLIVRKPLSDFIYENKEHKIVPYNDLSKIILRMLTADQIVRERTKE